MIAGLPLWVFRVLGGFALVGAVRVARWNGPRSPGAPASDLFVFAVGVLVLSAVIAVGFGFRSRRTVRTTEPPTAAGAVADGAAAFVFAGVIGTIYLFATLDFSTD